MKKYTKDAIALQLVRLLNGAFQWTEEDQHAVAVHDRQKPNKCVIDINGQQFEITIKELLS